MRNKKILIEGTIELNLDPFKGYKWLTNDSINIKYTTINGVLFEKIAKETQVY